MADKLHILSNLRISIDLTSLLWARKHRLVTLGKVFVLDMHTSDMLLTCIGYVKICVAFVIMF